MGRSIAAALLNNQVRSRQDAITQDFLTHGREIRPIAGLRRRSFGNNAGNHLVSLPEFHGLAGTQPSLQALGVPKLANVYAGHGKDCVTICDTLSKGTFPGELTADPFPEKTQMFGNRP